MICSFCTKENPDDAVICSYCGAPLPVQPEVSPVEPLFTEPVISEVQIPGEPEVLPPAPTVISPEKPKGIYSNKIWWLVGCFGVVLIFLCCGIGALAASRLVKNLPFSSSTIIPIPTSLAVIIPVDTIPLIETSTAPTDPNLLLFDDFSDPESGWDRVDEADYFTDYYSDTYRIIVYTDLSDSWANPGDNSFGDVHIEVDATKNGGPDDNDYGIICRYQSADDFYYGVISSDGYYGILKVIGGSADQLGYSELQFSETIRQGTQPNHMRFDCAGDVLSLYVNGQLLDQQNDSDLTQGNVGLLAGTYDIPGTDILFDNFTVTRP
ncbi:MAG: hypothetical protein C3F13_14010 [Anaerolineales bacterium]|nr:MAG: hypothetical protein C3F13_14010 [Anaerolineales bacterium]